VHWINEFIKAHPALSLPGARVASKLALHPTRLEDSGEPVIWIVRGKSASEVAENFTTLIHELVKHEVLASPSQCALLARSIKEGTIGDYRKALGDRNIQVAQPLSPRDHQVYQRALGTLLVTIDPHGFVFSTTFGKRDANLSKYLECCRKACQTDPALASTANELHRWLITDSDARHQQPVGRLLNYILNTPSCMELIERDPSALSASHSLRQVVDAYDRIIAQGKATIPFDQGKIEEWWIRQLYSLLARDFTTGLLSEQDEIVSYQQNPMVMPLLTIHRSKGLEFPVVAAVVGDRREGSDQIYRL